MTLKMLSFIMVCGWITVSHAEELFSYTEPSRLAQAAFSEAGVLDELLVNEGDAVKDGQVLARLDNKILLHDLNIAVEQLRLQKLRFSQFELLQKQGNLSPDEFERARADLLISQERVNRIYAQIDGRTLRARFDGVVLRIHRELSESIAAANTEVLTLAALHPLHVTFNVPLEQTDAFVLGQEMPLMLENEVEKTGRVDFISPVIDAASRTVRIRLVLENEDQSLRSGMRCTLKPQPAP
ncbi:efflux RND transporter periplasmic adaptor subunit [Kiritimatiellota bacterium B12222]|nr:efflux RND transporter periplasmic adaptor subunit [Kiritimatiellota bacterium B12222]